MFAGDFAPVNWAICDGSLLPISLYPTLFQLIGITYGGDGQSTFALPDLRGRVPIHVGAGFVQAESGGEETVTLNITLIPSHSHVPVANSNPGTQASPSNGVWAQSTLDQFSSNSSSLVSMANNAMGLTGGSQPHDNMMPFLAINFILSLGGIPPVA